MCFFLCFPTQNTVKDMQKMQKTSKNHGETHQNNLRRSSYHEKSNFQDLKLVFYDKHVCPKRKIKHESMMFRVFGWNKEKFGNNPKKSYVPHLRGHTPKHQLWLTDLQTQIASEGKNCIKLPQGSVFPNKRV